MDSYIVDDINEVTKRMKTEIQMIETKLGRKIEFSEYASVSIDLIYRKALANGGKISLDDQHLIGAILGSMFHKAYCDSRKLDKPNENGLLNNPRVKKLTDELDSEFVADVKSGKISQGSTLYVDENGIVCMDIANTEFVNLSPYWKKDNYMAGKTATRTVITCWEGLTNEDENVRKFVKIAVANGIHEAWISRGNVGDWNKELDTAYVFLTQDEKDKDLEHVVMATKVLSELLNGIKKSKSDENKSQKVESVDPNITGTKSESESGSQPGEE